jgi:hypothetical protein
VEATTNANSGTINLIAVGLLSAAFALFCSQLSLGHRVPEQRTLIMSQPAGHVRVPEDYGRDPNEDDGSGVDGDDCDAAAVCDTPDDNEPVPA